MGAAWGLGWDWRRRWARVVRWLGRTRSLLPLSGWVASWLALWLSRSTVVGLRLLVATSLLASEDGPCRKAGLSLSVGHAVEAFSELA